MSIPNAQPLSVAVTSWLVPGAASYNAAFLAARPSLEEGGCRIIEMGICCFCMADSLSYAPEDWPAASSPFMFHVHLPLDLPWDDASLPPGVLAGRKSVDLMRLLEGLGVRRAVLHPPAGAGTAMALRRLEGFFDVWTKAGLKTENLLLENARDLEWPVWDALLRWNVTSVCLDVAHLISYEHHRLLDMVPPSLVRLTPWSAPGPVPGRDAHQALTQLSTAQLATARRVTQTFPDALPLLEVFSWEDAIVSMPVLRDLYATRVEEGA